MAMNKTVLATAIKTALQGKNSGITGDSETEVIAYWEVIADEIIKHIIANAVISTTVAVASVTGVTGGGGTSGPGTGTGTGTVTA